jgi:hypothetical protein
MRANHTGSGKEKGTHVWLPGGIDFHLKTKSPVGIFLNVITPHMPTVSEGKEPDMCMFEGEVREVLERAAARANRANGLQCPPANDRVTIKSSVLNHMEESIKEVSDDRRLRFHWRQVFYVIRDVVRRESGSELRWSYFDSDLTLDWEDEHGEEKKAYRDARGMLYQPHSRERIELGTKHIEGFRRAPWKFNKVLYIEKECLCDALLDVGFPKEFDIAITSSKGLPTRAARDFIDLIAATDEPVQIFCLHDADAAGTIIYQLLQNATRARPERTIRIVDLGLEAAEAVELAAQGLVRVEDIEPLKDGRATAEYVAPRWHAWYQTHRVELNAFTTSDFIK